MKVKALQYSKDWNADDFIGKYHLVRIDQDQVAPIPGTQLRKEQAHEILKDKDRKSVEDSLSVSESERNTRIKIKNQLIELAQKSYVETIIGSQLTKIENVIKEKVISNNPDLVVPPEDSEKDISKFMKNIELGRHMYVGFAIVSGYKSINYQDSISGNTALHVAARKGYEQVVKELLEFKISPDTKNRIGNTAAHDAWLHWRDPQGFQGEIRSKEQRQTQEEKTCQILTHIYSYGGYIETLDCRGQSVLHIACRLGPVKAVMIILGFKADHHLRNKKNENMIDLATKYKQKDILKILKSWDLIKKETRKIDFKTLWFGFLKNYEAVISTEKSAEASMSEYAMSQRIRIIERSKIDYIPIDDNLLRLNHNANSNEVKIPKPWEDGWVEYAKGIEKEKALQIDKQKETQKMLDMREDSLRDDDLQSDKTNSAGSGSTVTNNYQDCHLKNKNYTSLYKPKNESISKQNYKKDYDHRFYTEKIVPLPQDRSQKTLNDVLQDSSMTSSSDDRFDSKNLKIKQVLMRRKRQVAQAILLDAQYMDTTLKSSMSSVLLHPVRIEEKNQYQKEEVLRLKDNVYNHVALQQNTEVADVAVRSVQKGAYKILPVALIDNKRKQFIESEILPPLSKMTVITEIENENFFLDDASLREESSNGDYGDNDSINTDTLQNDKLNPSILNRNIMLKKSVIVYGKGRLTSSYNSSLPLHDPWSYINGMYKPIEGDRTA